MATNPGSGTLATFLEKELTDRLLDLEKKGRQKVRDQIVAQLNPASGEASDAAKDANARVQKLSKELEARPAFPWVHPLLSAAAFETVQATVVQCWLMAGEPKSKSEIVPAVREYIRFQASMFSSAIGADRLSPGTTAAPGAASAKKKTPSKKKAKKRKPGQ